jgi:hypothetical protein
MATAGEADESPEVDEKEDDEPVVYLDPNGTLRIRIRNQRRVSCLGCRARSVILFFISLGMFIGGGAMVIWGILHDDLGFGIGGGLGLSLPAVCIFERVVDRGCDDFDEIEVDGFLDV